MAKKGNRQLFIFQCSVCKNRNYIASKNTVNIKEKLTLSKFCKHCRKTTEHKEVKL
ncbi:50S ribosomal protein L33 [Candidatus Daviesbacteria bacterium RIFCSPLOWO2_02_FULL_36_7]|uniref:Large ribosomal subunit protein bL33 n=1 Tax=Candidatus Daviesbacteria bacterium RIFCSPLOWO2_02_FULL_36_7 TaxID=1797792 RepID=A0A1F5MHZ5_9BACT|nr:MAG: 50S ribosomal protein L33 [Candidatus Daviesbacteria bacterium RIFCSPLOWO2_02_FULL_36_7]